MKALRYLALVISLFALSSSLVFSQSLAELAKKEKERRKQNKAEAKTVITDRELSSGRRIPSAPTGSRQSSSAEGEQASDAAAGEAAEGGQGEEEQVDETKTREYWQNRVTATKEKIAKLQEQLNSNDWGEGQRVGVDPRGMNNLGRRQETEQQLAAAQTELSAIREEARRAGVPAGWTR